MLRIYSYKNCSSCKNAQKFLDSADLAYEVVDIIETPPTKKELQGMIDSYEGNFKKLFNTSGLVYREMNLKDRMDSMSKTEALTLLSANGKLIKRPFLVARGESKIVGFKKEDWSTLLKV